MFNVCHACGEYHADKDIGYADKDIGYADKDIGYADKDIGYADKTIDPAGPYAICPACGHAHLFRQLPLLLVTGASGAGKSTVCYALLGTRDDVVLLDSDILWRPEFDSPETGYREFFELGLRMCKNIAQAGRPVVLFGAGTGVPENIESRVERRYIGQTHYLALVCDDDVLAARLRARPAWRASGSERYIEEHVAFNRWFKEQGPAQSPAIEIIDTTERSVDATAAQVAAWIERKEN